MNLDSKTILRTKSDVVCMSYPGEEKDIFVLQLGEVDQNVVINDGGYLIFALLGACDGVRALSEVIEELSKSFEGPEELWSQEVPEAIRALLAWKALEIVNP